MKEIKFKGHVIQQANSGICSVEFNGKVHKFRFLKLAKDFVGNLEFIK